MSTFAESATQSQDLTVPVSVIISIPRERKPPPYIGASLRTLSKRLRYGGKKGRSAAKRLKRGVRHTDAGGTITEHRLVTYRRNHDHWQMSTIGNHG